MLERASVCLETGGRQLFGAPKQCLRSRRMLHSSFWHHGASDLLLPVWWASSATPEGDVDSRSLDTSRSHDGPLFDFLYPEKTLALIHRLSVYGSDIIETRRRLLNPSGVRQFHTSSLWRSQEEEDVDDMEVAKATEEMEVLLRKKTAGEALTEILRTKTPGKQELAWLLYSALPDRSRDIRMHMSLLVYLASGDMMRVASRAIKVFDAIQPEQRNTPCYQIAISAYVTLQMIGPAIELQEIAAARFYTIDIGTDTILKRTINDDQWDLTLRVLRTFLRQAQRLRLPVQKWNHRLNGKDFALIWGQVAQLPDLLEHCSSFLSHMREFHHELASTNENKLMLTFCANGFVGSVMERVIRTPEPDEDFIFEFFIDLFRDLELLGIPTRELYEYIIPKMIDTPRYRLYTNRPKIWLELYDRYRQQCPNVPGKGPSRYLISRLIVQHGEKDSFERVDAMIQDLRTFYPKEPFTPHALAYVVRFYAKRGDVDRVHEYFDEFQKTYPEKLDLKVISSLVYAYARRIDVPGAVQQFKRINTEFGLVPDLACWNILLLAFTRADDLDGALQCFNNCLDSGLKPDILTFGPMLDLCATRGDVEAFETLFSQAKALNVPVETDRRARSGYIEVTINAGDPEGAEAIAEDMHRAWVAGSLSGDSLTHAWNLLISFYGVKGDLINTRRLYRQMMDKNIPMDSWTYAGLMRSFTEAKQTNAAYKILRVTMPENQIRVYAFHYAIVITGFLNERQYKHAQKVHQRMQARHIPQSPSSRQSSIMVTGVQELRKLKMTHDDDPQSRLVAVEEKLRESILADFGTEIANDQPSHMRYIDSPELDNVPKGYFSLVILLYSKRRAFEICKQLFQAATKTSFQDDYREPIALLTAIMEAHYQAKEYDEVEKCWNLARAEADRLVKTFSQITNPEPPPPEFSSLTDPVVRERFSRSLISTNRRQILFKAARIYIRSLIGQTENSTALQTAQRTVHNLLSSGFLIDNLTWNELIQALADRGRTLDAFSACEMYLMPAFPGWQRLNPNYIHHDRPGYNWINIKHYELTRQSVLPRYKTLLVLAAAFMRVKKNERMGIGYRPEVGAWLREVLEKVAPLTIRAIEVMPRTGDPMQRHYLSDE